MKNFFLQSTAIIFVLFITLPNSAWADHIDPFVQVTCSPDLNYFSLQTFYIGDTEVWVTDRTKRIAESINKIGVYTLKGFTESNYSCALPEYTITFTSRYSEPDNGPASRCQSEANALIKINVNHTPVYDFNAFSDMCNSAEHNLKIGIIRNNTTVKNQSSVVDVHLSDCEYEYGDDFLGIVPKIACKGIDLTKSLSSQKSR